jgi:muconolactone delta-isomerase
MEYLVSMTTQVPDGTSEAAVDEMRTREAARARELAAAGNLLRLWRPQLQPAQWRTLGLFAASDERELQDALVSMPLRIWRTDEVTALSPHSHDPEEVGHLDDVVEFLTDLELIVPNGTPTGTVEERVEIEGEHSRELGKRGHLVRLWRLPNGHALGLWRARDAAEMQSILDDLPLGDWMRIETTPLAPHPSDPALVGS